MPITDRYKSLHSLSPAQSIAIDVLDSGGTHLEAGAADVDRTTVSRWATKHPEFVAELNRRKRERAEQNAARVSELTLKAIGLIGDAMDSGDAAVALAWVKQFGVGAIVQFSGPTTATAFVERKRVTLAPANDLMDALHEIDGKTIERAYEVIAEDLEDA